MEPTLSALKAFVAVAERQHFARAARDLFLTPPALSQQIARLEKQLGTLLFDRSSRNVELTPAGISLLPLARDVINSNLRLTHWRRKLTSPHIRLGFSNIGPPDFTAALLDAVAEQCPDLFVDFQYAHRDEITEMLASGTLDVGFFWGPVAVPGLETRTLVSEPRVLVLNERSALALDEEVDINELSDLVMVAPRSEDRAFVAWSLEDPRPDGTRPRVGSSAENLEETLALVAATEAGAFLPLSVAMGFHHRRVERRQVLNLSRSQFSIGYAASGLHEPAAGFVKIAVATAWDLGLLSPEDTDSQTGR